MEASASTALHTSEHTPQLDPAMAQKNEKDSQGVMPEAKMEKQEKPTPADAHRKEAVEAIEKHEGKTHINRGLCATLPNTSPAWQGSAAEVWKSAFQRSSPSGTRLSLEAIDMNANTARVQHLRRILLPEDSPKHLALYRDQDRQHFHLSGDGRQKLLWFRSLNRWSACSPAALLLLQSPRILHLLRS